VIIGVFAKGSNDLAQFVERLPDSGSQVAGSRSPARLEYMPVRLRKETDCNDPKTEPQLGQSRYVRPSTGPSRQRSTPPRPADAAPFDG
jgi:hypothetical protein